MLESDSSSSSSSDSDENTATEATTWRDVESCEVQLQVNDVERTLLIKSRTEAGAVLARLRRRMFGSSSSGRASVGDLVSAWMGESILSAIKNVVNRSMEPEWHVCVKALLQFVEVELWLSYYAVTPTFFYHRDNRMDPFNMGLFFLQRDCFSEGMLPLVGSRL
ncbi:hypothetical protein PInf_023472 [Phytophthora infestans]|nr:hypothetical protein PInf_023472 [Phytophthora infestans]